MLDHCIGNSLSATQNMTLDEMLEHVKRALQCLMEDTSQQQDKIKVLTEKVHEQRSHIAAIETQCTSLTSEAKLVWLPTRPAHWCASLLRVGSHPLRKSLTNQGLLG
jgi:cob(I)alamin adenosyltransferase